MAEIDELFGRKIGDYILHEKIGEGGFAKVYRGEQPTLGRKVVVKVLHAKLRVRDTVLQRFLREAQLAARLDHPCVAHIYAFDGEDDGLVWIAMEYVPGVTLKQRLRDHGPMSLEQFVPFFESVAEVVQYAHEQGIVHRDLKPSNIMVLERGGRTVSKLLDFGVAMLLAGEKLPESTPATIERLRKLGGVRVPDEVLTQLRDGAPSTVTDQSPPPASGRLTPDDATVGTPGYMAPEQWSHEFLVSPAADLYSLAVIAYEALTSRRPFQDLENPSVHAIHAMPTSREHVPPLGSSFPPALDHVFQRALALHPDDRYANALELAGAIRAASGIGASSVAASLLAPNGRGCVDVWPLAQAVPPAEGAPPELFLFDAHGRPGGARMIAGLEVHGAVAHMARDWVTPHVVSAVEAQARMRERILVAAHEWQDRDRPNDLLWRGEVLADLERWLRQASGAARLGDIEAFFVAASRRAGRRVRRLRRLLVVALVAIVLAAVAGYSVLQAHRSRAIGIHFENNATEPTSGGPT